MPDSHLPDEHHFARQCSGLAGSHFSDEEYDNHEPPWLHGNAFQPTSDNPNLSGSWVQRLAGTWEKQIERVRKELITSNREMRKTYQLAIIQVDNIKKLGRQFSRNLHVLHTPDNDAGLPSHSEIRGIDPEDYILQQRLADLAQIEPVFPEQ